VQEFFGLATLSIFDVSRLPETDATVVQESFRSFAGVPALNAAVTYSILGGGPLASPFDKGPFAEMAQ
jgi:hypothetical protein